MIQHPRCPFCHDQVKPADEKWACQECMAWHHSACWDEGGKCSTCGNVWRSEGPWVYSASAPVRSATPTRRQDPKELNDDLPPGIAVCFATCPGCHRSYTRVRGMEDCGCGRVALKREQAKNSAFLRLMGLVNRLLGGAKEAE